MSTEEPKTDAVKAQPPEEPVEQPVERSAEPAAEPALDPIDDPEVYPLRAPEEDAVWAVRTVKIWIGIALTCIAGILLLLVLGLIYD